MGAPSYMRSVVDLNVECVACLYSNPDRDKRFVSPKLPDRHLGPTITLFSEQWGLFPCPRGRGG